MSEYKLVPVIPTMEIVNDIVKAGIGRFGIPTAISLHSAMLASCPDVSSEPVAQLITDTDGTSRVLKGYAPQAWNDRIKCEPLYTHPAPVASEPVAYNHHFIQDDDLMPEEVLSHSPAIPAIMGCKYTGRTDKLFTTPQPDKVAELEAKLAELVKFQSSADKLAEAQSLAINRIGELEAKLALAREALQDVVDSGLLNGSYTLHDETSNKVHEALKQIGGTE
jgi:hypothetical protein